MKNLIINGSPRRRGDSGYLIEKILPMLEGDTHVVRAYYDKIGACLDCRFCWKSPGCVQKDGMVRVYEEILDCENILIVSPVYFRNLTPPMLQILSRMQVYYGAEKYFQKDLRGKKKKGALFLLGGGNGKPDMAQTTGRMLLHQMNAWDLLDPVMYLDTDNKPAQLVPELESELHKIADFFNQK